MQQQEQGATIRVVTKWTARRSNKGLVVEGVDPATGRAVKVTAVQEVIGASPNPHCTGNIRGQGRSTVTLRGN